MEIIYGMGNSTLAHAHIDVTNIAHTGTTYFRLIGAWVSGLVNFGLVLVTRLLDKVDSISSSSSSMSDTSSSSIYLYNDMLVICLRLPRTKGL